MIIDFFHFLGGLYFALFLMAALALVVLAGTLIESATSSHLYAAEWTYQHPLFSFLLICLFINILFSALRRYPFKMRHVPFLITHLGLLMVISGTLIKQRYGFQGNLSLSEGSGSSHSLVPHTYALHMEKKGPSYDQPLIYHYPLAKTGPNIQVLKYIPHAVQYLETWIKGSKAHLVGLPPLPVEKWDGKSPLKGTLVPLQPSLNWLIYALQTDEKQKAIQETYLDHLTIRLTSENKSHDVPLKSALKEGITWQDEHIQANLDLKEGHLKLTGHNKSIHIDLQGRRALSVQTKMPLSFEVDLLRPLPVLLLIENSQKETTLFAFDRHGRFHQEAFKQNELSSLLAYDQGYAGYTVQASIPFPSFPAARSDKEKADRYFLAEKLRQASTLQPTWAPPLNLLKKACEECQVDFIEAFLEFLWLWHKSGAPLFSHSSVASEQLKQALDTLQWPQLDQEACQWICLLFDQLTPSFQAGENLLDVLKERQWPFFKALEEQQKDSSAGLWTHLAQQIFSVIRYLPKQDPFPVENGRLLSAYLTAYGIDYGSLLPLAEKGQESFDRLQTYWKSQQASYSLDSCLILECPLTTYHLAQPPLTKREDNRPLILVEVKEGSRKQILSLAYDPAGTGLKWPLLNGAYVARFQPQRFELPYRLRLRQARQINYPNSEQPYSYEADLLITDRDQHVVEKTLSMNHVYETWDGYRFYLAGMAPANEQSAKRIQIIVNRDPAKYIFTYPGALLVALGSGLLFWLRPYRKKRN